jgi:hypothetical protein
MPHEIVDTGENSVRLSFEEDMNPAKRDIDLGK